MAAQTVVDPRGNQWTVRRRWVHRRLRWRGPGRDALGLLDGGDVIGAAADLPVVGIIFLVIALILIAIFAVLFVIPALIFLAELLVILAIVGVGLIGRLLFGRPWTVEARIGGDGPGFSWQAKGWRGSRQLVHSITEQLRATGQAPGGVTLPSIAEAPPAPTS